MRKLRLAMVLGLGVTAFGAARPQQPPSASQIPTFTRIAALHDPMAIPLYPGVAPGSETRSEPEIWDRMGSDRVVRNVTRPTITPVLPVPEGDRCGSGDRARRRIPVPLA